MLPTGKLPHELLGRLLEAHRPSSRSILMGPGVGEDAAAVLTKLPCMVVASDPVTCVSERLGWHVVHVNANDVATRGAEPLWFLCTLLIAPHEAEPERIAQIFDDIATTCKEVGAELIGGHTEVTSSVQRTIAVGTMIGEVTTFRLTATRGATHGDTVLLVGAPAVEGTAVLAREKPGWLRTKGVGDDVLERAARLLDDPGISVLSAVRATLAVGHPHSMHDVTEGGLATGLWELSTAARHEIEVEDQAVQFLDETRIICDALGLDPWGLMASGALLVTCDDDDVAPLQTVYRERNLWCARLGRVGARGVSVKRGGQPLPQFARDELIRALEMF
jgi:hydrogenase maturation factor